MTKTNIFKEGVSIRISPQTKKSLLQLKLDWDLKSVDEVIIKLIEIKK
jgi:hypothetical protein